MNTLLFIDRRMVEVLVIGTVITWNSAAAQELGADPKLGLTSAEVCARCHQGGRQMESPQLVLHTEYDTWKTLDPHSRAHSVLDNERSREIGKKLYGGSVQVSTLKECVSCHGTDAGLDLKTEAFAINKDGVSCVACHGSATGWIVAHALGDSESWMRRCADEKSSRFGLNDLRDPGVRATVCLSCHSGNSSPDKVLTHAMYAAGHPPLSTIDLTESSRRFPKHWMDPRRTPYIQKAGRALQRTGFHYVEEDLASTRKVTISALARLQCDLEPFRDQVERSEPTQVDFARFDCASCHRELELVDDATWKLRLSRKVHGGGTSLPVWPEGFLSLVRNGRSDTTRNAIVAFLNARRVPYARVGTRGPNADMLSADLNKLIGERKRQIYGRASTESILKEILELGESPTLDFNSARQIAWSAWAIASELELVATRESRSLFASLDEELSLDLFTSDDALKAMQGSNWLFSQARFDPATTRGHFRELAEALGR